jgi:hypothetical protein
VDPKAAARALAIGRIVFGGAMLVAPRRVVGLWLGRHARTGAASVMTRATGARDVLLGGMVLHTLEHPEVAPRWVASTGAMDAVDGLSALAVRGELPGGRGPAGIAFAAAAAGLGLYAARGMRAQTAAPAA